MKNLLAIALITLTCMACSDKESDKESDRSIEAVADEYLAALLQRRPELGTTYSLPGARHDRLFDNSQRALLAWQVREDQWLRELEQMHTAVAVVV